MSNLILGYGLLGKEIHRQTGWDYISKIDKKYIYVNGVSELLHGKEYDNIINCIGYTKGEDKSNNYRANIYTTMCLIDYCMDHQIKLVHISTDYIYSGSKENASEADVPITNNSNYTYSKLVADTLVKYSDSGYYLILRGTHKKKPFTYTGAWADQVGNFDYVDVIADLYIQLINKGATGIYNVGTETKTMYDLAKQTKADVVPIRGGNYPKNVTMNLDKMKNFLK